MVRQAYPRKWMRRGSKWWVSGGTQYTKKADAGLRAVKKGVHQGDERQNRVESKQEWRSSRG
ncbi:hypothetical protein PU629_14745 [Pullulanibacillus sp. KACC 23026]|uniref:hypothetical protein n=1 Tax=Pullulanibacillus sp. KACC 23026 TaxID=3028315 RepID=UPI0023AFB6D9|nr:hypothetical protein [Pullulanibacillus sp. KACC 23026]WEG11414.1 hypothetical protein PU629_14745 [Pullulanibacillus sp. KACC 23026]